MLSSSIQLSSAAARLASLDLPANVRLGRTVSERVRRLPSDIEAVDTLLAGGWPRGRLSELIGARSSGKTSILFACLAAATRRGEVVACIDVADALHPESLARSGADLGRLLWVRPPAPREAVRCAELLLQAGGFGLVVLDFGEEPPRRLRSHTWPRLARATEQSHAAFLVVTSSRVAGSCAALGLAVRQRRPRWRCGLWSLFDGLDVSLLVARNKFASPGDSAELRVAIDAKGR